MSIKKAAIIAALTTAQFFTGCIPAFAATSTLYAYDATASYLKAGSAYSNWSAEAGIAYHKLLPNSSPAAAAVYYECLRRASKEYYSNLADFYDDYFSWLAIADSQNASTYLRLGPILVSEFESISEAYDLAYSESANPESWGGTHLDHSIYHRYLSEVANEITKAIYAPAVAAFAGGNFQIALIYDAAGEGVFDAYEQIGLTFYHLLFPINPNTAVGLFESSVLEGLWRKVYWDTYAQYYRNLVSAYE